MNSSAPSSSGSSSSGSRSSRWEEHADSNPSGANGTHFSFSDHHTKEVNNRKVPEDQERQILLLMLLAQVCALHDPTPRTFTVHVLELFERGILDRQSIHFLFDLGLVPSSARLLSTPTTLSTTDMTLAKSSLFQRSREASAIRSSLVQQEEERLLHQQARARKVTSTSRNNTNNNSTLISDPQTAASAPHSPETTQQQHTLLLQSQLSFAAEQYPLSLSRYQREFDQQHLLSSGSFGDVFCATNKLDARDYAVKRVSFQATGYARDSLQQVIREVHCLAVCDHPHVVRYYTSWLEPSWMTGSGTSTVDHSKQLLTNIQRLVSDKTVSDDLQAYFKVSAFSTSPRQRRYSLGDSETVSEGDCSEWTVEADQSRDDLYVGTSPQRRPRTLVALGKHRSEQQQQINDYRYQICLYVQMQLCKPSTLADWIRSRNQATEQSLVSDRINNVSEIFQQIAQGLEHVHAKGIVHRDLKPANVFATCGEGLHFKIGDFGLSKQIAANVTRSGSTCPKPVPTQSLELAITQQNEASWNDPLTAGVGTASYAAPEQVATRNYGTEADVYSFGLILLELLSSFSTEHERMQTFSDCRHRRELPRELVRYFPIAADTILACTEPSPLIRPKAYDLARLDLTNGRGAVPQSPSTEVCSLRQALVQKDEEIESLKQQLGEKQQTIDAMISNGTHKPAYWMLPQSVPEQGLIGISNSLFVNGGNAALHSGPASSNSSSSSEGDL